MNKKKEEILSTISSYSVHGDTLKQNEQIVLKILKAYIPFKYWKTYRNLYRRNGYSLFHRPYLFMDFGRLFEARYVGVPEGTMFWQVLWQKVIWRSSDPYYLSMKEREFRDTLFFYTIYNVRSRDKEFLESLNKVEIPLGGLML